MKPEDAEEYTQALGQVVAGGWRQIALGQRLGVPKALGLTVDQWVKQRLGGYVKYSIEERAEAVRTLADEGFTTSEIKGAVGSARNTIRKALKGSKGTKPLGGKLISLWVLLRRHQKTGDITASTEAPTTDGPTVAEPLRASDIRWS